MECDDVVYEKRDGVAGVQFRKDGEEGWTPVSSRRSKRVQGERMVILLILSLSWRGRLCFSIRWMGLLGSPCEPGEPSIGCTLQQELGTD